MKTDKFLERRNKIRRTVVKQKIDALLITNLVNIRYLTGFTGSAGRLLIQPDGDTILSDPRYTIQLGEQCPGLNAVIRPRSEPPSKTLLTILGKTTVGKLGIEAESLTVAQHERLFESLSRWQSVPTKNVVEELRQIKDKDEIAQIRRAVKIAGEAFEFVSHRIASNEPFGKYEDPKPVKQWQEDSVSILLDGVMRLHGADDRGFPTIIAAGARSALPHAVPTGQIVGGRSHLLFDWGCVVNGYMSDITRVLIFDRNNKKLRTVYETVLKAQTAAIAAIKPGKTCEEIDAVARNIITDAGFGKHFGHGLGHSFGLEIHEDPRFVPGCKTVLKAGMVLTVEPGIYLKGWGGVRIEDDILVTKTGYEVLSRDVPKAFDEMVK